MAARPPPLTPGGALASRLVAEMLGRDQPGLPPGTRFGSFKVLRELGRGGLGVVYLAERADGAFEQQVALKVIRPDREHELADTLLARERRILAKLRHPGIAHIIDGGHADGAVWFAMEYVQGERIDRYCQRRRLDGRTRLSLLCKVAEAVAYAHARLVAHRDIKPVNILVEDAGEPRLLDFGIAAALDEAEREDPARRASTPGFASPEQSRGEAGGTAADIYQLGRLLELLMQDVAFPDAEGLHAMRRQALDERPEHRYPSADAFVADLRALLVQRPVAACGQRRGYRSRLFLRRHRLGVLATVLAGVSFLAMVGYFLWGLDTARQHAEREAATARRVSEFMVSVFEGADPSVHKGQKLTVEELLARGRERIERDLSNEPQVRGALLASLGRIYLSLDDIGQAQSLLHEAVALGEKIGISPSELADRKQILAKSMVLHQQLTASRYQLNDALAMLRSGVAASPMESSLLRELDVVNCFEGDVGPSIERLTLSIANARGTLDETRSDFVADLFSLGVYLQSVGRIEEAVPLLREAHQRARRLHGVDHPATVDFESFLGLVLSQVGRQDEAIMLSDDAVGRTADLFGIQSARWALMQSRRGHVGLAGGDIRGAIERNEQALAIIRALPVGERIYSVQVLENLGDAYMAATRFDEAEVVYREMLQVDRNGGSVHGPDIGQRTLKLAQVLANLDRCEEASDYLRKARSRSLGTFEGASIHRELQQSLNGCPVPLASTGAAGSGR